MDVAEDAEGALDPRIQIELENLNNATDDINKLETELNEAHIAFRQLLSDITRRLKEITDKLGTSCIEKARCYYEALELARQAQVQCQQQAQLFRRASEIHAAAKETVALAEARFMSHQHEWNFDQAWQDMLNHATIKVMDAENQKAECGREHHRRAMLFHDAEKKLLQLEEKHRRSIIKARPYFEVKAQCDQMLATQKDRVEHLQLTVKEAKRNYARSLRTLEEISNQIHQQRRDYDIVVNGPREPGVGAELISSDMCQKHENEFNGSDSNKISSVRYNESGSNEKLHDIKTSCSIKEDAEKLDKRSVDGSESKFMQWEMELQASMEKLNRLSLRGPPYMNDNTILSSTVTRNALEIDTTIKACHDFLFVRRTKAHNLQQFPKSNADSSTGMKDTFADKLRFQGSCSTINSSNIVSKSVSKSLNSSPVNRSTSNTENRRLMERTASVDISKHVPNRISPPDIQNGRTQSSCDTNVSQCVNVDVASDEEQKDNCNNTNDTSVDKNGVQFTNLSRAQASCSIEFLSAEANSADDVNQHPRNLQDNAAILPTWSSCSALQKIVSCSANSSPTKVNPLMSSVTSLDNNVTEQRKRFVSDNITKAKTISIKELPLLSLFGRAPAFLAIKSKSMINLDNKQNLKMLLNNSHLADIQAISTERLSSARHNLVNDSLETKTDVVKK